MIHRTPLIEELRIYDDGKTAEAGDEFRASMLVCWQDAKTAELRLGMGELSRSDMRAIRDSMVASGCETLLIKRRIGRRVPFGMIERKIGNFAWWRIDIKQTTT